jgi:hypothetical protein
MGKDDVNRYTVLDGYAFFTGDPSNKDNIHEAGSTLVLTPEQVEKSRQAHKLVRTGAVVVRCNNQGCDKEYETEVVQIQYAVCSHCGGRGGELLGPAPKTPPKAVQPPEGASTPGQDETGDSGSEANDSGGEPGDAPPDTQDPPPAPPGDPEKESLGSKVKRAVRGKKKPATKKKATKKKASKKKGK